MATRKNNIYGNVKFIISLIAGILGLSFGFLTLSGIPIGPFLNDESNIVFKIAMILYYFSWTYGVIVDLRDEEFAIHILPNNNKLSFSAIGLILILSAIFAFLCYAETPHLMSIALTAFVIFNVLSWLYVKRIAKSAVTKNKENIKNQFHLLSHEAVVKYLYGNWQWLRFGIGFGIILIIDAIVLLKLDVQIAQLLSWTPNFVVSLALLLFVLYFEIHIWYMRVFRITLIKLVDELNDNYQLLEKETNQVSAEKMEILV